MWGGAPWAAKQLTALWRPAGAEPGKRGWSLRTEGITARPLQTQASRTCILSRSPPEWRAGCSPDGEGEHPHSVLPGLSPISAPWFGVTWIFPGMVEMCSLRDFLQPYGFSGGKEAEVIIRMGREEGSGPCTFQRSWKWWLFQNTSIYSRHNSMMTVSVPSHRWKWNFCILSVWCRPWGLQDGAGEINFT